MCEERSGERYIATPDIPMLVDWKELYLCKKCARREHGSKNKEAWERMHER